MIKGKVTTQETKLPEKEPLPEVHKANRPEEKNTVKNAATSAVYFQGEKFLIPDDKKTSFKIALILPFTGNGGNGDARLADIMYEYYRGVQVAVNQLENQGFDAKLYVYDSRNDSAQMASLLNKKDMKGMDAIVGPIGDVQMKMVSKFGLANHIPVFSPFTPLDNLAAANPKFCNFTPDHLSKARVLADFFGSRKATVFIIRDGKRYDKEFVPVLTQVLDKAKVNYKLVTFSNYNSWSGLLADDKDNYIYIPTTEKNVVSVSLGNIFASHKKVHVIGEYKWTEFVNNDYRFWEALDVHLLAANYLNPSDASNLEFIEAYRLAYKIDPGEYACMGYAQFKFIGDAMGAFGQYFPEFTLNRKILYPGTVFNFGLTDGLVKNKNIWILQYQNNALTPIAN